MADELSDFIDSASVQMKHPTVQHSVFGAIKRAVYAGVFWFAVAATLVACDNNGDDGPMGPGENMPAVYGLSISPNPATVGEPVAFTGDVRDEEGISRIVVGHSISTAESDLPASIPGDGPVKSFDYSLTPDAPGDFVIEFTTYDSENNPTSKTYNLTVNDDVNEPSTASIESGMMAVSGTPNMFKFNIVDKEGVGDIRIDFGDGTSAYAENGNGAASVNLDVEHAYMDKGDYPVTVEVTDSEGELTVANAGDVNVVGTVSGTVFSKGLLTGQNNASAVVTISHNNLNFERTFTSDGSGTIAVDNVPEGIYGIVFNGAFNGSETGIANLVVHSDEAVDGVFFGSNSHTLYTRDKNDAGDYEVSLTRPFELLHLVVEKEHDKLTSVPYEVGRQMKHPYLGGVSAGDLHIVLYTGNPSCGETWDNTSACADGGANPPGALIPSGSSFEDDHNRMVDWLEDGVSSTWDRFQLYGQPLELSAGEIQRHVVGPEELKAYLESWTETRVNAKPNVMVYVRSTGRNWTRATHSDGSFDGGSTIVQDWYPGIQYAENIIFAQRETRDDPNEPRWIYSRHDEERNFHPDFHPIFGDEVAYTTDLTVLRMTQMFPYADAEGKKIDLPQSRE